MNFGCHQCGMHLQVDDSLAGTVATCPGCQCLLEIPRSYSVKTFTFYCGTCRAKLRADSDSIGNTVTCPVCSGSLQIPAPDEAVHPGATLPVQQEFEEVYSHQSQASNNHEFALTFDCYQCSASVSGMFRSSVVCSSCGTENRSFDAHSEILPHFRGCLRSSTDLVGVFNTVRVKLASQDIRDEALTGDILLLLTAGRSRPAVNRQTTSYYGEMLAKLARGDRWRRLCQRLALLKRLSRGAGARGRGQIRTSRDGKKKTTPWQSATDYIVRNIVLDLIGKERAPDEYRGLPWCDYVAWSNHNRYQRDSGISSNDSSEWLVTDHLITVSEIASRAEVPENVQNLANKSLIELCSDAEIIKQHFEPRQLEIIRREGDKRDRSPGEHSSVRAVSKKNREDQIVKILPSEFSTMKLPDRLQGRRLTLDKILNRSPLIYQHYQPEKPEIRHRICLPIVIGAESNDWNRRISDPCKPFNRARLLGYEILLNSALWMPFDRIQVDVVWLEMRSGEWRGAEFSLRSFSAIRNRRESYRNTLEANRLLPYFFAKQADGIKPQLRHEVKTINESPNTVFPRLINRHVYRGIYPSFIMESEEERRECLPPSSLKLPPGTRQGSNALMAFSVHDNGETSLHADFFSDLTGAWVANLPLPRVTSHSILVRYLEMVIGPIVGKGNSVPAS